MWQTESPGFRVIGRLVRNPVRMLRNGMKMWLQFRQRHRVVNWDTVVDDMEIRLIEIDNASAVGTLDVGVLDIPLFRNNPIEDSSARWYLLHGDVDFLTQHAQ